MPNLETFCKSCHGLTKQEIIRKINAEIISLKGRVKVKKKSPRFSIDREFAAGYESDAESLNRLAEFISGDYLINLDEYEKELFDEVKNNMK